MTWYDGGPAPDPARREPTGSRGRRVVPDDPGPGPEPLGLESVGPDPADPDASGPGPDPFGVGPLRATPVATAATAIAVAEAGPVPGAAGRARLRDAAETASAAAWAREPAPPDDEAAAGRAPVDARPRLLDAVRWRIPSRTALVAVAALVVVGGAVALRAAAQPTGEPVTVEEPAVVAGASPQAAPTPDDEDTTVWVHVVGQVASPGVVALPSGSRVGEAVTAAGGALPEADLAGLNLAAVVQDGAQVRVPAPGEAPEVALADGGTGGAPGGGSTVDVNTAGAGELQTLPGIGPVLAERVVAFRTEHGAFADVDALRDVPGIGPAVLSQIRDLVRV